jgi:hypothetical protein
MFAPISARFASLCSRNGISAVETETICAGETSMQLDVLRRRITASPSEERQRTVSCELAVLVELRARLRDHVLRLLDGVEVDDLVGDLAVRRPSGTASG